MTTAVYKTSVAEIRRRKKASLVLVASLMAGYILAGGVIRIMSPREVFVSALAIGCVMLVLRALALMPFTRLAKRVVLVTDEYLKIDSTVCWYKDMARVSVRETSRDTVRDVHIVLKDRRNVVVDALDNFPGFLHGLSAQIDEKNITTSREPLDYDHFVFYPIVGLVTGALVTGVIEYVQKRGGSAVTVIAIISVVFLFVLGVYFIAARPLSMRYAGRTRLAEIICGSASIIAGLAILAHVLI
ncbi:MAG: hypothetical protein WC497_00010 [Patescibacteria group bacterium]